MKWNMLSPYLCDKSRIKLRILGLLEVLSQNVVVWGGLIPSFWPPPFLSCSWLKPSPWSPCEHLWTLQSHVQVPSTPVHTAPSWPPLVSVDCTPATRCTPRERDQEEACVALEMGIPGPWVLQHVLEGGRLQVGSFLWPCRFLASWRGTGWRRARVWHSKWGPGRTEA